MTSNQFEVLDSLVGIESSAGNEHEIIDYIRGRMEQYNSGEIIAQKFQKLNIVTQAVGNEGRSNLIVEKGDPDGFVVMLYAHVDTVPRGNWENKYKLARDPDHPEHLRGVGVYDMKAGIMVLMDILEKVDVPKGIKIMVVFGVDEEKDSRGLEAFLDYEGIQNLRGNNLLIGSPEIASTGAPSALGDVVDRRRGSFKSRVVINAPIGHSCLDDVPNAIEADREVRNHLTAEFTRVINQGEGYSSERLKEAGQFPPKSPFANNPNQAGCDLEHFLVRTSVAQALQWQQQKVSELSSSKKWREQGITHSVSAVPTAYDYYATDTSSPVMEAVKNCAMGTFGRCNYVLGLSPADTNALAYGVHGKQGLRAKLGGSNIPIFETGPVGGNFHEGSEWVSESSIAKLIEFYKKLITCSIPKFIESR